MPVDHSLLPAMLANRKNGCSQHAESEDFVSVITPSAEKILFSIEDYSLATSVAVKKINDFVFIMSVHRILKVKQLKDITMFFDKISSSFDLLNNKIDETKLLAINTLINSSLCGLSGESFSGVVKQVNVLCNQSKNFLVDIKTGIEKTNMALDGILSLIKSTIETELNVMTTLKTQVDYCLGKLATHLQYLQADYLMSDYRPFKDSIESDFQRLLSALLATHDHVVLLMSKPHKDMQLASDVDQWLQQLKNLCAASLLFK